MKTKLEKNYGSSWNRVGEKKQLKVREAALAAGGNTVATVVESGMIGACQLRHARVDSGMRIAFQDSARIRQ